MTRRRNVLAAMLSCALAGSVALAASQSDAAQTGPAGKATARAHATLAGEGVSGTVEFVEMAYDTGSEVEITLTAKGLKPGLHGVHLHAVGKCEPPAFTAAGGHFDPGPAGNTDPDANHPFHMGDIPNLRVGADGSGTLQARTTRVTLSAGPLSLFDADGSAVIVHGNPDQGTTGEPKSGVSGGPRVACGAIEKK
ncbi:MAG TPA: superoxide dismutase family protein [Vicinamibacterales bacterium]|jgi:Cu-Zn family superoxide dismutase|nr:superoxide dismutase family protein [Vicinamibacterales bacterium]